MSIRTIEQKISAGNQFDGQLPTTTIVRAFDMERFPEDAQGGLFDFGNDQPLEIRQFAFFGGGQSSWSLVLVDVDGNEYEVLSGTSESSVFDRNGFLLLEGQKLKLTTTGASTAMTAWISADLDVRN